VRVARSGRYVLGAEVAAFEQEFAALCGASWAVGVGSGTDALALILRAAGVGPGDEVIGPAYTAAATWMAVAQAGARPVGVDVDPRSGLIDGAEVASAVGSMTAAIVTVDLFGRLSPVDELRPLADRHGLLLVQDAAHAAGVREHGSGPPGSGTADAVAFSFYPTKPLACLGDAGAVATDRGDLAAEVRRLRSYGWSEWNGRAPSPGINSRLDEIQAAVLRGRLAALPEVHERLQDLGRQYRGQLAPCPGLSLPPAGASGEPPWHQFVVGHADRDRLREELSRLGVGTAVHYDPIPPRLEAFAGPGVRVAAFPGAEALAARSLSLPLDAWLTDAQVASVSAAVLAASRTCERSAM
jgi:dTDP-3-amino-3,4,6-trideoxy-alpha-D-glucose transaminase